MNPTDDSDTSSVVDDIPAANHKNNDGDNKPNKLDEETEDDHSEENDDKYFNSTNKEDIENTQDDDETVINAEILDTSMSTTNDAEMSLNGITCPNNNIKYTNRPSSFISDIEFASTETNRKRSIVINDQINKCKLYCYIFVILSY